MFNRLAILERKEGAFSRGTTDQDMPRNESMVFRAAVLELAHAISRGRRPSSCSVLPGVNLQVWLREMFCEVKDHCRNHYGEKCTIAEDMMDTLMWFQTPEDKAMLRAIKLCDRYVRPSRLPSECRGDYKYQMQNANTRLKRKRAYHARQQGSCYDTWDDY